MFNNSSRRTKAAPSPTLYRVQLLDACSGASTTHHLLHKAMKHHRQKAFVVLCSASDIPRSYRNSSLNGVCAYLRSHLCSYSEKAQRNSIRPNDAPRSRGRHVSISDFHGCCSSSRKAKTWNCQRARARRSSKCNSTNVHVVVASSISDMRGFGCVCISRSARNHL